MKGQVVAEISVVPIGTGSAGLSQYIAACIDILDSSKDLSYQLTPMGTIIEGPVDRVMEVARQMHETPFGHGVSRVDWQAGRRCSQRIGGCFSIAARGRRRSPRASSECGRQNSGWHRSGLGQSRSGSCIPTCERRDAVAARAPRLGAKRRRWRR